MARAQTRRNVSFSAKTYERIRAYCALYGISMSSFVERRIKEALDAQPEDLLGTQTGAAAREMFDAARRMR